MTPEVFDARICELGEGPIWHPERGQFFWFDILGKRLLSRRDGADLEWPMGEFASAAGWIDTEALLVAGETGLYRFDIARGTRDLVMPIEADDPTTRSNDGRADPAGGFWIGTMGKSAEPGKGAIYRYYRGELRRIIHAITIPNSICFLPDGSAAFYTCSCDRRIMKLRLDTEGWPEGEAEVFVDLRADELNPDGAVIDAEDCLWSAQWGASRVACYGPDGSFDRAIPVPGRQPSCPAFGGADLDRMLVTTAHQGMTAPDPADGRTYLLDPGVRGTAEPRVLL